MCISRHYYSERGVLLRNLFVDVLARHPLGAVKFDSYLPLNYAYLDLCLKYKLPKQTSETRSDALIR